MNKAQIERLHKQLCKELNIKPAKIELRNRSRRDSDEELITGIYDVSHHTIIIYRESVRRAKKCLKTLIAHETYHRAQHMWGQMWRGADGYNYWKYIPLREWNFTPWSQRPWERAAIRYERKIAKREGWV